MGLLSATELADMLRLSKGRISQLVSEGKLDGCFTGDGRQRRFDPEAVAKLLGKRLDPGQSLGNGATTKRALAELAAGGQPAASAAGDAPPPSSPAAPFRPTEPESEYEAARTAKVLAEARRAQRMNAEAEGTFVLADEVARQVRRQIGQELAEVTTFIRDAARIVADRHQIDFKAVRQIMLDQWRAHRGGRAEAAEETASVADMSQAELDADI